MKSVQIPHDLRERGEHGEGALYPRPPGTLSKAALHGYRRQEARITYVCGQTLIEPAVVRRAGSRECDQLREPCLLAAAVAAGPPRVARRASRAIFSVRFLMPGPARLAAQGTALIDRGHRLSP